MTIHFGLSKAAFHAEYREKQFLLLRGALRDTAFDMRDIDQVLHATEPTAPFLKLHNGTPIPEEAFVEVYNDLGSQRRRIVRPRLHALLRAGATMILNRVDARHPLIRSLCLQVAKFVSQHTLANGYLAVANQASFGKHWDCHDVFAVQLHGRKRWQLYKPTFEQPLSSQTSKDCKHDCPAEPVLDTILEAGDVLYVPRGWWHCATPIGEETFHVAIGVHPPFVLDYFSWLCSNKLPAELACRQSLSFEHDNAATIRAAAASALTAFHSEQYLDEYLELIGRSDRVPSPFDLRAGIAGHTAPLPPSALVTLNTIYPRVRRADGAWIINGAAVVLNEGEQALVEQLADGKFMSFAQVGQLPALQGDGVAAAIVNGLLDKDIVQVLPGAA